MRKRQHWKVGPVEFDLVTQVERREADDPAALPDRRDSAIWRRAACPRRAPASS